MLTSLTELEKRARSARHRNDADLWAKLADAYARCSRHQPLRRSLTKLYQLAPAHAKHKALGHAVQCYSLAGLHQDALQASEKLRQAVGDKSLTVGTHLELLERCNQLEEATQLLAQEGGKLPSLPEWAQIMAARVLRRLGKADEARSILNRLVDCPPTAKGENRALVEHERFLALDQLGEYSLAWESLNASKIIRREMLTSRVVDQGRERARRRRDQSLELLDSIEHSETCQEIFSSFSTPDASPPPVFLLGHPRSGTTLLEAVLARHPKISGTDERDAIENTVLSSFAEYCPGEQTAEEVSGKCLLDSLLSLPSKTLTRWHKGYLRELRAQMHIPSRGIQIVEKNPGLTGFMPALALLFPASRVLFSSRDAKAVCWSSFRIWSPGVNAMNVFWLDLQNTMENHHAVCQIAEQTIGLLAPERVILSKHEDLVANLPGEGRRITERLGLEWLPSQEDPRRMPGEEPARSPSYAELSSPVRPRANASWVPYSEFLPQEFLNM